MVPVKREDSRRQGLNIPRPHIFSLFKLDGVFRQFTSRKYLTCLKYVYIVI